MRYRAYYLAIGLLLFAIAGVMAALAYLLLKTPLGPPIEYQALPKDYTWGMWIPITAGFALAAVTVIVELGMVIHYLRELCQNYQNRSMTEGGK